MTPQPKSRTVSMLPEELWHDPTHGQIDRDIQEAVDEMVDPQQDVGKWMAICRTL